MANLAVESEGHALYFLPMEDRVSRLEGDMVDVKSLLARLEPMIIRIDATLTATLPHLATKADVTQHISDLRAETNQGFAAVRAEMNQGFSAVRAEMNQDFSAVRTETNQGFAAVRAEMNQGFSATDERFAGTERRFSAMDQKLSELPTRTYMWGILGVLVTAYGAGLAALAVIK